MNRFEKRKLAIERAIREEIEQYKSIYAKADEDDRDPSEDERLDIESHLQAIETLKEEKSGVESQIKTLEHVDDIGREIGPALGRVSVTSEPHDRMFKALDEQVPIAPQYGLSDLGQQFTNSAGYKSMVNMYRDGGRLPSNFTTGVVDLQQKAQFGEGLGGGTAAGGWALASVPQVVPGVVDKLFQRLTIADLILSGQATQPSVRYVAEGTFTNTAAAGVGEGSVKPETTLGLTVTDTPITKIAVILPVTEEMIADGPAIQAYINGRLTLAVQIEEERQLLRGGANSAEATGFFNKSIPIWAGTANQNKAQQVFKPLNAMRGSYLLEPEWIVVGSDVYEQLRLLQDTAGQYLGGGPFLGQYGNGGLVTPSNQVEGGADTIWGKPLIVSSAMGVMSSGTVGTALIGTRANAQCWRKGGLSVEASNSHSDFFYRNLIAIRAEERLGLAVYRTGGYVEARLNFA